MAGLKGKSNAAKGPSRTFMGDGDQLYENNHNKKNLASQGKSNDEIALPGLSVVDEDNIIGADDVQAINTFKMKIISKLRRHLLAGSKLKGHINEYGVNFTQLKTRAKVDRKEMMCHIKSIKFHLLNANSSPLVKDKTFPTESLFSDGLQHLKENFGSGGKNIKDEYTAQKMNQPLYRSCAVVPNSAALDGSKHGINIDSHEFVLRFNNAPTEGYEEDVGEMTSMRIVNSQVVTKPKFKFPYSNIYVPTSSPDAPTSPFGNSSPTEMEQDVNDVQSDNLWNATKKYLIWDPCNFTSTFEQWYLKPDFPFFNKYFSLTNRSNWDRNRFYVLNCRVIWKLWEILQRFTFARIYGNPPTSGFIGIMLALQKCHTVDIYEIRESERCHYYGLKNDTNGNTCTYGTWHPVSAEKLFFLQLSESTDKEIFYEGVLSIPGVSQFKC